MFINFLLWAYNVGILTSHRILDIDYVSILQKEVSGSTLDDITDVTGTTTGFFRAIFDYGDIFIQTAGLTQNIEFRGVPEPNVVVAIVSRVIREHKGSALVGHENELS